MKVYSLYYNDTYVVSFPNRADTIYYGIKIYGKDGGWECNIIEEYLSKSPLVYSPPHYTSLHSSPSKFGPETGITVYPGTAQINTTRAETENTIYAPGTK